jgi:hypothetical protein
MTKKPASRRKPARKPAKRPRKRADTGQAFTDQVFTSNLALHDLFQQQADAILDKADISEEQRQSILVAMSCPCCGAGGMSLTVKLRPKGPARFVAEES